MQPHGPILRGRNLVTLQVQELVGGYVLGEDIVAVSLQHRGEYDAVEDDVILADEVYHLGLLVLPILLPVGCKVLSSRDITDRSVKPYVQHLTLLALNGHGNTPIQIAAYSAGLKACVEPRLTLAIYV